MLNKSLPVTLQQLPLSTWFWISSKKEISFVWQGLFSITLCWLLLILFLSFLSLDQVWLSFPLFCPEPMSGWLIVTWVIFLPWCCHVRNICLPNFLLRSKKYWNWSLRVSEMLGLFGGLFEDSLVQQPGPLRHLLLLKCRAARELGRVSSPFPSLGQDKVYLAHPWQICS